jgi:hypothetical protein
MDNEKEYKTWIKASLREGKGPKEGENWSSAADLWTCHGQLACQGKGHGIPKSKNERTALGVPARVCFPLPVQQRQDA